MDIANASMLDEGTAAAEAMTLAMRQSKSDSNVFYVAADIFRKPAKSSETRAKPLGIEVRTCASGEESLNNDCFLPCWYSTRARVVRPLTTVRGRKNSMRRAKPSLPRPIYSP